jgi:hypothetical protein
MPDQEFRDLVFESFCRLEQNLTDSRGEMRSDGRKGVTSAIRAIIDFIHSIPRWESMNLALPMVSLLAALHDLDLGRVAPMLRPTEGFDNRKPDASLRKIQRAYIIFSVDQLIARGMRVEEACRFVADLLTNSAIHIGGHGETPVWKTLRSWRYYSGRRSDNDLERTVLAGLSAQDLPGTLSEAQARLGDLLPRLLRSLQPGLE